MAYRKGFRWLCITAALQVNFTPALMVARPRPATGPPRVSVLRAPSESIQPQTSVTPDGTLHMIYFKGSPEAGDIYYVRRAAGSAEFTAALRVNSQPGSAVAVGTVRGPQLALGRNDRAYVVWFGSDKAEPRGPGGATPVLFTRFNDARTAFEPQRTVMQYTKDVDGGLSVAADRRGDVYVVWHATGSEPGEAHRRVYLARSQDDGRTFSREVAVSPEELGACGCCGMRARTDGRGRLLVIYRAAAQGIHRDMTLLISDDAVTKFKSLRLGPWELNACPMSTASIFRSPGSILAAWETAGQVYFDRIDAKRFAMTTPLVPPGSGEDRKHPAVAANETGWVLLCWTEGTGWKKGGSLAWQLYDPAGRPAGAVGAAPDMPVWDLPSVFADGRGNFTIVY